MPTLSLMALLLPELAAAFFLPTTTNLLYAQTTVDEMAVQAMFAGAVLATAGLAMRPAEMVKLSLHMLTPLVELVKLDEPARPPLKGLGNNDGIVVHGTNLDAHEWHLPPLATIKEACYLLESTLKHDIYLCTTADRTPASTDLQCAVDREISDHYGEPVYLCMRAA